MGHLRGATCVGKRMIYILMTGLSPKWHIHNTIIPCPGVYSLTSTWLGWSEPNTPSSAIFLQHRSSHCTERTQAGVDADQAGAD